MNMKQTEISADSHTCSKSPPLLKHLWLVHSSLLITEPHYLTLLPAFHAPMKFNFGKGKVRPPTRKTTNQPTGTWLFPFLASKSFLVQLEKVKTKKQVFTELQTAWVFKSK